MPFGLYFGSVHSVWTSISASVRQQGDKMASWQHYEPGQPVPAPIYACNCMGRYRPGGRCGFANDEVWTDEESTKKSGVSPGEALSLHSGALAGSVHPSGDKSGAQVD